MSHAEVCPICHGTGKVEDYEDFLDTTAPLERTCHGCGGKGWVSVDDGEDYPAYPLPMPVDLHPWGPIRTWPAYRITIR